MIKARESAGVKAVSLSGKPAVDDFEETLKALHNEKLNENWPTWLTPNSFELWFHFENWCRTKEGKNKLPIPLPNIVEEIMKNGKII